MPDCDKALELISAHIDGALTDAEEARLTQHLNTCPVCRALLADLEALHRDMADLAARPVPPPADLREGILEQIAAQAKPASITPLKKRLSPWRTWGAMAAVFAVVILGAGGLYGSGFFSHSGIQTNAAGAAPSAQAQGGEAAQAPERAPSGDAAPESGDSGASPSDTAPASGGAAVAPGGTDGTAGGASAAAGGGRSADSGSVSSPASSPDQAVSAPPSTPASRNTLPAASAQPFGIAPSSVGEAGQPASDPAAVYCGILNITWAQFQALSLLDTLPYTVQGDTRWYTVDAPAFSDAVEALSAEDTALLTQTGAQISADAAQGLIIVTGAPAEDGASE